MEVSPETRNPKQKAAHEAPKAQKRAFKDRVVHSPLILNSKLPQACDASTAAASSAMSGSRSTRTDTHVEECRPAGGRPDLGVSFQVS